MFSTEPYRNQVCDMECVSDYLCTRTEWDVFQNVLVDLYCVSARIVNR